ncbi:MAG TPA: hydantoinase/oxoprolinase family protein, partial [Methylomirabilota bacterium]|nr:hydantoinase/oxoprolinase family protein [Methylomirabilota bacterium]
VVAVGGLPRRGEASPHGAAAARDARTGERPVYFRGAGWLATPSYARAALTPGARIPGPAVIEQEDATPLVAPGFEARVDDGGNLILERR